MQRDWAGSDPPAVVRLDDLIRFLVNPAQGFARASLGFGIPAMPELPDDALPVRMDPLAGWGLKARLLDGLAGGHELEALIARERGADRLPPGSLAEIEIDRARRDVTELWTAAVARGFHQPHHQWIRGRVEVAGRLVEGAVQADPVECHVAIVTPSRMKASHRLRVLIEMAFLAAVDPDRDWHGLVLARRPSGRGLQETVIAGFGEQAEERRAEALDVLAALVGIYDDGHRAPLPLPCETGLAWHRNAESSRSKAFREAAAGFEGGFNPERDDAAFRLLFADVSSMSQLLDTGFEELSARLWGLAVPRLKERGA
jgi:exodeoxyribonuclease V gamma subunit